MMSAMRSIMCTARSPGTSSDTRRLPGALVVYAVDFDVSGLHVVGSRADAVQARRELRRIGGGIGCPVIRERLHPQPVILPFASAAISIDVVIAGEGVLPEVFRCGPQST